MNFIRASKNDLDKIIAFYDRVIDQTADMEKYARWIKGLHPTVSGITAYLEEKAMYLLMDGETVAGAMAVTMSQPAEYHPVEWGIGAKDEEVSVIHILGVNPDYQGKGLGKALIDAAVRIAREEGKLACRLDALASNIPAHRMYESKGFAYRGTQRWYAENTGWTDFFLYEYIL